MNNHLLVQNIRRVLPDLEFINFENHYDYETQVNIILSQYFQKKKYLYNDLYIKQNLTKEAADIHSLWPSVSHAYILEQLEIFKDMPQRVEIVLRIILASKTSNQNTNSKIVLGKRVNVGSKSLDNPHNQPKQQKLIVQEFIHAIDYSRGSTKNFASGIPISSQNSLQKPCTVTCTVTSSFNNETSVPVANGQGLITENAKSQGKIEPVDETNFTPTVNVKVINEQMKVDEPKLVNLDKTIIINNGGHIVVRLKPSKAINLDKTTKIKLNEQKGVKKDESRIVKLKQPKEPKFDKPTTTNLNKPIVVKPFEPKIVKLKQPKGVTVFPEPILMKLPIVEDEPMPNLDESKLVEPSMMKLDLPNEPLIKSDQSGVVVQPSEPQMVLEKPKNVIVLRPVENSITSEIQRDLTEVAAEQELVTPPIVAAEEPPVPLPPVSLQQEEAIINPVPESAEPLPLISVEQRKPVIMPEHLLTTQELTHTPQNVNPGNAQFNLVRHVQSITGASVRTILHHCRRLHLPTRKRPSDNHLELLMENVLTDVVDLDSSDDEDGDAELIKFFDTHPDNLPVQNTCNQYFQTRIKNINEEIIPWNSQDINAPSADEPQNTNIQLVNHLCSVFPDACPRYIRLLCANKPMNDQVLDELITVILDANGNYPRRPEREQEAEVFPENQYDILREVLPDADPDYLRMVCDKFEGDSEKVKVFINDAMEKKDYPKLKDYERRQQLSAQQKQYTTEFNVVNFLKVIPDPDAFFSDKSRDLRLDLAGTHYALVFLRNVFNKLPVRAIQGVFQSNNSNLQKTYNYLQNLQRVGPVMKSVRKSVPLPNNIDNIPLLQEIAYLTHRQEIHEYLVQQNQREEVEKREIKLAGLMRTCNCCFDEEVLPRDIYTCEKGCEFCKSCIIKSVEVRFGEGKLDFPCLGNCDSAFTLQTLQTVLSPKLFSRIAQKKTLEEVKAAGIEELEMCPFCDFATIPAEGYTIFTCLNPECMKESCRMCKEPSHIPLRCDEIEKDEDVKARVFVENKMTEALLKQCWKCGIKFYKEDGCNKMTCSCGAAMCYICGKPVTNYTHFNGNGGDRYDLCPLYSDTNVVNKENVLKGAAEAKAELGNVALKNDPTKDVSQHYQERRARQQNIPPFPVAIIQAMRGHMRRNRLPHHHFHGFN